MSEMSCVHVESLCLLVYITGRGNVFSLCMRAGATKQQEQPNKLNHWHTIAAESMERNICAYQLELGSDLVCAGMEGCNRGYWVQSMLSGETASQQLHGRSIPGHQHNAKHTSRLSE